MTPQRFFVVTNQAGQYLQMTYYPSEDAFYSSWEALSRATYFKTEKEALERALIEEDIRKEVTNICNVQIHMQHMERTAKVAKRFIRKSAYCYCNGTR